MNDSAINSNMLSSADHLENVEQLIKNLEKQTLDLDNFEDIMSNRNRQEIITKSFSSVLSNNMAIDDVPEDNFLVKSISFANHGANAAMDGNLSMDSLFNQRDLFDHDDSKKQQTPPANDQSLYADQESAFTWDDGYDTRANYRLTFSTHQQHQTESKMDKTPRHKHHHRHKQRPTDPQASSMCSDDGLPANVTNQMNDWSMRSSLNVLEQSMDQGNPKSMGLSQGQQQQQANFIRSHSHPTSFSPPQQIPANNNSSNSSTTSSSSSASWRKMKDSQRTTSGTETKEARPPSPMNLYKIFQQKSQMAGSTSSRSAFQFYRQQADSLVPNTTDSMTISGEKLQAHKARGSHHQKKAHPSDRRSSQTATPSTDQAIQTSMFLDSSSNSPMNSRVRMASGSTPKSESYDHLSSNSPHHLNVPSRPSPAPSSSSTIHKSLPDLAFITQYSKEIPRSRTTSPLPPTSNPSIAPSPSPQITQQKQDAERPRTLKSIKRYKNSKHSTEPLGVFYSPQLRKTFAAVPTSAVVGGFNEGSTIIKMKLPPSSQTSAQQASNLKSCLKYGPRANSCDIQAMLQDGRSPVASITIPEPLANQDSISPGSKRRCSETDAPPKRPEFLRPQTTHTTGSSNDLNAYLLQNVPREHYSDHDLAFILQQNQTKKSVSFSENIAKHLISPCNPAIKFDAPPELADNSDDDHDQYRSTKIQDNGLTVALHGNNRETPTRKVTPRYGEMRRCQTDIIVMDRVHHLHSFTESPPNEFRFQETDSLAPESDDDQAIQEKTHVNIVPNLDEPVPVSPTATPKPKVIIENTTPFNDKENESPEQTVNMNASTATLVSTNDSSLDGLLERVANTVKHFFDIKRSQKTFFLANDNITQLDTLLKDQLCIHLQQILEHGLKPQRKDLAPIKQVTFWKIIETSIDHGPSLQVFHDAKQAALNASPYWLFQFQAFIFNLLNKNELINWLYHFMKQKEILQRYYQAPDALILLTTPSAFDLFDRTMAQLEKLSPLAFRLTYHAPPIPSHINEQLNTSTISVQPNKSSARDWMMSISRRPSKTLTQPIVQPAAIAAAAATPQSSDTLRSTFTRKINSLFTKTNTSQPPRKTPSAVTGKLPTSKPPTIRVPSPAVTSPAVSRRPRLSNVFANASAAAATSNKPVIVASPKVANGSRSGSMRRGISPSVLVAPSPPPAMNTAATTSAAIPTFQSKIPRPSLNVDKPKSARYRSTALPPK